jgi:hypothetical protein
MDSKEIHSSPNPCQFNLAVEDLIADSQINADLPKVKENDLPYQITSTSSIVDQNIESSEKLNFTHKKNLVILISLVSYFESLTPDLRDSDYEWSYKSIEGLSSSDERSDDDKNKGDRNLNSQDANDRSLIYNNKNNYKASEEGRSIPLNGALNITNDAGDNNSSFTARVDVNNVSNNHKEA